MGSERTLLDAAEIAQRWGLNARIAISHLLELTSKGYLQMEQRGKAFVFSAASGLQEKLAATVQ